MSYILDALRKSEAARRSREAPDLLAQAAAPLQPAPAGRAPKYAGRPAWAVAAIGASALAAALWLRFAPAGDPPAGTRDAAREVATIAADAAGRDIDGSERGPAATAAPGLEAGSAPSPSLDPGRPPGVIPGMAPVATAAPPVSPPPTAPATGAVTAPRPVSAAPQPAVPVPAAPASGPITATTSEAAAPGAAPRRPAAAPAAPPPGADGRPVTLADIAPELRRQLPPLRMSMHLWNEAPERRLLVLDGQRLRQGDVLGELVVERIDRDGAVLAWRGARIALPVE